MRRTCLLIIALAALSTAPVAHAGTSISRLPTCTNGYLLYAKGVSRPQFRAALLCLINGARKGEHLPALKRAAPLESVAESQTEKFAATGSGSHGQSLTDIATRFRAHGYVPAAYNEAFAALNAPASPYSALYDMVRRAGVPCSEIFDPRFRDIGIGISADRTGQFNTVTLEFGLRAGARQPSTNTRPAATCGHPIPAPVADGAVFEPLSAPTATSATTVSFRARCDARVACKLKAKLTLRNARVSATDTLSIGAHETQTVTFTFDADALMTELAAAAPHVDLTIDVTAPVQYHDSVDAGLSSG